MTCVHFRDRNCNLHGRCEPFLHVAEGRAANIVCPDYRETSKAIDCNGQQFLQVKCISAGIGDNLMVLAIGEGLRQQFPGTQIAMVCGAWVHQWLELFDCARLITRPIKAPMYFCEHDLGTMLDNYRKQGIARWDFWGRLFGTQAAIPMARPLPASSIKRAAPYSSCIVLVPFAAYCQRSWPLGYWLELERLLMERGQRCLILHTNANGTEQFASEKMLGESAANVAALMQTAAFIVGNDSGMAHLAGMLRRPAVAICSTVSSDANMFGLYPTVREIGDQNTGLHSIQPATVLQAVLAGLPKKPPTLLDSNRIKSIVGYVQQTAALPGDMAELGSFKGGSAAIIAAAARHKKIHVFDSLGLPADDMPAGHHRRGEFSATEAELRDNLAGYNVEFHLGTFPATASGKTFSFVHLDGDLYQTTADGLAWFGPRMVNGGIIVCDDYGAEPCPGVKLAVDEFLANEPGFDFAERKDQCVLTRRGQ